MQGFETIGAIRQRARDVLSDDVWEFLVGGASGEQTLEDNVDSLAAWSIVPRYLSGLDGVDTRTVFGDLALDFPVMTSPIGSDRLFDPEGQVAIAQATSEVGVATVVSEASGVSMETVEHASPGPKVMQLHTWGSLAEFDERVGRAAAAGYVAVCATLDCPRLGWRERNRDRRFTPDPSHWNANDVGASSASARLVEGSGQSWSWSTLAAAISRSPLPVMVKGVVSVKDADAAVQAGASAVIVSNHGGRQLDCVPAVAAALPEIADCIGGRVPIGMDGGVRRGTDVLKALALGADIVLLGRVIAMALAAGGATGVHAALRLLREELELSMLLAGLGSVKEIDRSVLRSRAFPAAPDRRLRW